MLQVEYTPHFVNRMMWKQWYKDGYKLWRVGNNYKYFTMDIYVSVYRIDLQFYSES